MNVPVELARLEGHDVVEGLAERKGDAERIEVASGQGDGMPGGYVDLVDLQAGPVQQRAERAAVLRVIAVDRQDRRQVAVGEIERLNGPGAADVGRAGDDPHPLQGASGDVDVGRGERPAAQIRKAGGLGVGVAGAGHGNAGCGRNIYCARVAGLALYRNIRLVYRIAGIADKTDVSAVVQPRGGHHRGGGELRVADGQDVAVGERPAHRHRAAAFATAGEGDGIDVEGSAVGEIDPRGGLERGVVVEFQITRIGRCPSNYAKRRLIGRVAEQADRSGRSIDEPAQAHARRRGQTILAAAVGERHDAADLHRLGVVERAADRQAAAALGVGDGAGKGGNRVVDVQRPAVGEAAADRQRRCCCAPRRCRCW